MLLVNLMVNHNKWFRAWLICYTLCIVWLGL